MFFPIKDFAHGLYSRSCEFRCYVREKYFFITHKASCEDLLYCTRSHLCETVSLSCHVWDNSCIWDPTCSMHRSDRRHVTGIFFFPLIASRSAYDVRYLRYFRFCVIVYSVKFCCNSSHGSFSVKILLTVMFLWSVTVTITMYIRGFAT